MKKHGLVYAVLIVVIILVAHSVFEKILTSSTKETLAQESKPKNSGTEKKVKKENVIIEQFCQALKNRDLVKFRECLYQAWTNNDSSDGIHDDFFSDEGYIYKFINGKIDDDYYKELTEINIINYLYVVDKAGIFGRVSIHLDFKCGNKDKEYVSEFSLDLKKHKSVWMIYSHSDSPGSLAYSIYEYINEPFEDDDEDDNWDDDDKDDED